MPLPKKSPVNAPSHAWVLIALLAIAIVSSMVIVMTSPVENSANSNNDSPVQLSQKLIAVKKDPLPKDWKNPNFIHSPSDEEKQKAAVDVVYNAMLSRVETLAGIPSTLPPETVVVDCEKYLTQIYGSSSDVPSLVYRVACLRIVNTQVDFQRFYKGGSKKLEAIVYQVIAEYYDRGKPPVTLSVSSAEDYFKAHQIKRQKPNQ